MREKAYPDLPTEGPWSIEALRAACARGYSGTMGIEVISAAAEELVMHLPLDARHTNSAGGVHGGVLAGLADACAAMATMHNLPAGTKTATTDSQTQYLRPASGPSLRATARLVRFGRSRAVWSVEITNAEGKPVTVTTQAQAIIRSEGV